jgi:hypothetical protein
MEEGDVKVLFTPRMATKSKVSVNVRVIVQVRKPNVGKPGI